MKTARGSFQKCNARDGELAETLKSWCHKGTLIDVLPFFLKNHPIYLSIYLTQDVQA